MQFENEILGAGNLANQGTYSHIFSLNHDLDMIAMWSLMHKHNDLSKTNFLTCLSW